MKGERDSTGKGLKPFANYWHLGLRVFPGTFTLGHLLPLGSPSQRQLGLTGLGQLGTLPQNVTLPIPPIYANAAVRLGQTARALSALLVPDPVLRSQEGAASEPTQLSLYRPLASQGRGRATEGRAATCYLPWTWVPRCRTA